MMSSFSSRGFNKEQLYDDDSTYNHQKKPRRLSRMISSLKTYLSTTFDTKSSKKHYIQSKGPASGFEGDEVYGVQAEMLDDDDMAWGSNKRPSRQERKRNTHSQSDEDHKRSCWWM